jgi:hypothetical protein
MIFAAGSEADMVEQNCYHNNIPIDGDNFYRL